jgi:hypothetical protein
MTTCNLHIQLLDFFSSFRNIQAQIHYFCICHLKVYQQKLEAMKKRMYFLRVTAAFMALAMLISGCASTTLIQSDPTGAKVYLDGEPMGKTPYTHTDTKITGSPTQVKLVKEGYEDFHTVIVRNEEVDVGAVVGGVFFLIPFLWVMKYKPVRTYELTPTK